MKAAGTEPASSGLRDLFRAAQALDADALVRKAFRERMRVRLAGFLGSLATAAELGRRCGVDAKRAGKMQDPGDDGVTAPLWSLATMSTSDFDATLGFIRELRREIHGEELTVSTREQRALVAMHHTTTLETFLSRALFGDMRIDDGEAHEGVPLVRSAIRHLRALLAALGVDPDAEEDGQ